MTFWDRFILYVYLDFRPHLAHGQPAASRLFNLAYSRNLFDPANLNDLSILLLTMTCPADSALRNCADDIFVGRGLDLPDAVLYLRALLQQIAPQRDAEAIVLHHAGNAAQQGQMAEIVSRDYGPRLREFLGRRHLSAPASFSTQVRTIIADTLGRFGRIPLGTIDFASYLYRRLPRSFAGSPPPAQLPIPVPAWYAALTQEEQRFIQSCLGLNASERTLMYLAFYAKLDVRQLTQLFSLVDDWTEDVMLDNLVRCWEMVLNRL